MVMDVAALAAGLQAAKTGFDVLRTALGLLKDVQDVMPAGEKKDAVATSLNEAEKHIQIATAQIAQGFGYPLCRCNFPPTPMLEVGEYFIGAPLPASSPIQLPSKRVVVHQCPRCNRHDGPQNDSGWTVTVHSTSG
jgi:hypothetical protein